MPNLKAKDKSIELKDGDAVLSACEELGVPFGCTNGVCGTCTTVVLSGVEHLGAPNGNEKAMGLKPTERLMCQCKIRGGDVTIDIY